MRVDGRADPSAHYAGQEGDNLSFVTWNALIRLRIALYPVDSHLYSNALLTYVNLSKSS
jgi:hypothetical protein